MVRRRDSVGVLLQKTRELELNDGKREKTGGAGEATGTQDKLTEKIKLS